MPTVRDLQVSPSEHLGWHWKPNREDNTPNLVMIKIQRKFRGPKVKICAQLLNRLKFRRHKRIRSNLRITQKKMDFFSGVSMRRADTQRSSTGRYGMPTRILKKDRLDFFEKTNIFSNHKAVSPRGDRSHQGDLSSGIPPRPPALPGGGSTPPAPATLGRGISQGSDHLAQSSPNSTTTGMPSQAKSVSASGHRTDVGMAPPQQSWGGAIADGTIPWRRDLVSSRPGLSPAMQGTGLYSLKKKKYKLESYLFNVICKFPRKYVYHTLGKEFLRRYYTMPFRLSLTRTINDRFLKTYYKNLNSKALSNLAMAAGRITRKGIYGQTEKSERARNWISSLEQRLDSTVLRVLNFRPRHTTKRADRRVQNSHFTQRRRQYPRYKVKLPLLKFSPTQIRQWINHGHIFVGRSRDCTGKVVSSKLRPASAQFKLQWRLELSPKTFISRQVFSSPRPLLGRGRGKPHLDTENSLRRCLPGPGLSELKTTAKREHKNTMLLRQFKNQDYLDVLSGPDSDTSSLGIDLPSTKDTLEDKGPSENLSSMANLDTHSSESFFQKAVPMLNYIEGLRIKRFTEIFFMSYRNMHLVAASTPNFRGALQKSPTENSSRDLSEDSHVGVAAGNADMPSQHSLDGTSETAVSQLESTGQSTQISVSPRPSSATLGSGGDIPEGTSPSGITPSPKIVARHVQPIFQAIGFNQCLFLGWPLVCLLWVKPWNNKLKQKILRSSVKSITKSQTEKMKLQNLLRWKRFQSRFSTQSQPQGNADVASQLTLNQDDYTKTFDTLMPTSLREGALANSAQSGSALDKKVNFPDQVLRIESQFPLSKCYASMVYGTRFCKWVKIQQHSDRTGFYNQIYNKIHFFDLELEFFQLVYQSYAR